MHSSRHRDEPMNISGSVDTLIGRKRLHWRLDRALRQLGRLQGLWFDNCTGDDPGKAFVFCTSYINDEARYRRWIDNVYSRRHSFGADGVFLINDGPEAHRLRQPAVAAARRRAACRTAAGTQPRLVRGKAGAPVDVLLPGLVAELHLFRPPRPAFRLQQDHSHRVRRLRIEQVTCGLYSSHQPWMDGALVADILLSGDRHPDHLQGFLPYLGSDR